VGKSGVGLLTGKAPPKVTSEDVKVKKKILKKKMKKIFFSGYFFKCEIAVEFSPSCPLGKKKKIKKIFHIEK
jgi:hypothetical protein